jgi:hypothetical protein
MEERREMKKLIVTRLLGLGVIGLASPASAAEKYFVTIDTVGNCSVVQGLPGTGFSAGKEALGATTPWKPQRNIWDEIRDDKCEGVVVG